MASQPYATESGFADETLQRGGAVLTTKHGHPFSDNQNSLRAGMRGPTLMKDFHLDHELAPERTIHARRDAVHGVFTCTDQIRVLTAASVLSGKGEEAPVFFSQGAIKLPDLVHSVKTEADRGDPQAASAHDTFRDFIARRPESLHTLIWAMSGRALPRSLRMMEGFGIHILLTRAGIEGGEGMGPLEDPPNEDPPNTAKGHNRAREPGLRDLS